MLVTAIKVFIKQGPFMYLFIHLSTFSSISIGKCYAMNVCQNPLTWNSPTTPYPTALFNILVCNILNRWKGIIHRWSYCKCLAVPMVLVMKNLKLLISKKREQIKNAVCIFLYITRNTYKSYSIPKLCVDMLKYGAVHNCVVFGVFWSFISNLTLKVLKTIYY